MAACIKIKQPLFYIIKHNVYELGVRHMTGKNAKNFNTFLPPSLSRKKGHKNKNKNRCDFNISCFQIHLI